MHNETTHQILIRTVNNQKMFQRTALHLLTPLRPNRLFFSAIICHKIEHWFLRIVPSETPRVKLRTPRIAS